MVNARYPGRVSMTAWICGLSGVAEATVGVVLVCLAQRIPHPALPTRRAIRLLTVQTVLAGSAAAAVLVTGGARQAIWYWWACAVAVGILGLLAARLARHPIRAILRAGPEPRR